MKEDEKTMRKRGKGRGEKSHYKREKEKGGQIERERHG